jgi:hypothetical protein
MKKKNRNLFHLFALALGEKSGKDDSEADKVAIIRIFIFLSVFITNCFIVFGVVRTNFFPREIKCVTIEKLSTSH